MKPLQIYQHAPEPGAGEVALLGEQAARAMAGVFETARVHRDGERHMRRFARHAEMVEQGRKVRIVRLIVDNEAGVHRDRSIRRRRVDGAGMAAQPVFGLEQHHLVAPRQQPGRRQAGDARTHHRDAPLRAGRCVEGAVEH